MPELKQLYPQSVAQLRAWILARRVGLVTGSKTSTVIAYDKLDQYMQEHGHSELDILDLSQMPGELCLNGSCVSVTGNITWKTLRDWLAGHQRMPMTYPTEELAQVISGAATSATGERCFGLGTLREQIKEITFLDWNGHEQVLSADRLLSKHPLMRTAQDLLIRYQADWQHYRQFKNAPFPRMERETDLMIGTEGQLGIIIGLVLETLPMDATVHYFIQLPRWEENDGPHCQVHSFLQSNRMRVRCAEFMDSNSLSVLPEESRPIKDGDMLALELLKEYEDDFLQDLLVACPLINEDSVFAIEQTKLHKLRMDVPRATFEENMRAKVVKMGTDAQVSPAQFKALMALYRQWSSKGFRYNLFGHFGDSHLHFNFLPKEEQVKMVKPILEELYPAVLAWRGSPFAEHGIGLIKKKFITKFYGKEQFFLFEYLKDKLDPHCQFFPWGYMQKAKP